MTPTSGALYPVFSSYRGCVLHDSPHGTRNMDAVESQGGDLQNRPLPGAYRRPRGRDVAAKTVRRRWVIWFAAGAARMEDGVRGCGLADESMDAAALDETLCQWPLRRLLQRVGVLAGALLVLAAGEAG